MPSPKQSRLYDCGGKRIREVRLGSITSFLGCVDKPASIAARTSACMPRDPAAAPPGFRDETGASETPRLACVDVMLYRNIYTNENCAAARQLTRGEQCDSY